MLFIWSPKILKPIHSLTLTLPNHLVNIKIAPHLELTNKKKVSLLGVVTLMGIPYIGLTGN
jgi:hypothetical protein